MPLEYGADLVGDVICERIDPVSVLLDIRHAHTGQGRNSLRFAGHVHVGSDEVDVEGGPGRVADEGRDRKADTPSAGGRPRRANLEAEPVADVHGDRLAQLRLSHLPGCRTVDIYVDSRPDTDITRQQSRGTLHDPAAIDEVQTLEEPVVGHLPLELLEVPAAGDGEAF